MGSRDLGLEAPIASAGELRREVERWRASAEQWRRESQDAATAAVHLRLRVRVLEGALRRAGLDVPPAP